MRFSLPSWLETTQWRLLCNTIPECLALLSAVRDLEGKDIYQTEARAIEKLWTAAGKGVDEWERRRTMRGSAKPTLGQHRSGNSHMAGGRNMGVSDAALLLLTVVYDGIVVHVDRANVYHFYPFTVAEGQGKLDQLVGELQSRSGYKRYSGQKLWENGIPLLSQIYVYGHCEPGIPKMVNDTETTILDSTQLAMRLIASGLQKEFSGRVKVFGCHSGVANHDNEDDEESVAEALANAMRARKYNSCEFFGYTEALRYSNSVESATGHKYAITAQNSASYETSLRNPSYYEKVVKQTLWKVYAANASKNKLSKYDMIMQEMTIRDALDKERDEVSRIWYSSNEVRASEVRKSF